MFEERLSDTFFVFLGVCVYVFFSLDDGLRTRNISTIKRVPNPDLHVAFAGDLFASFLTLSLSFF